jgi:hypothetical protein
MGLLSRVRRWFRQPAKESVSEFSGFGLIPDPGLANWNWFRQWAGIFQLVDRMARARGGNLVEIPLDDRMVYIARGLMRYNTYAQGFMNALRMHTLGAKGFKYIAVGNSARELQYFLDKTHDKVNWWSWEREIYQRTHVEGNSVSRFFPQEGWVDIRPIEPEWIIPKDGSEEWTFGFYNEPGDVQDVTALHTLYGQHNEVVDGNEWYHVKGKMAVRADKRGISDFLSAATLFDDSFKAWRNFVSSEAVRAAIVYFSEQPEGVNPEDVAQAIARTSEYGPPTQPPGAPREPPLKLQWGAAGVEHIANGNKLAAPPQPNAQSTVTAVNAAMLAAGRAYHVPLVLMTGDMSANNTLDFSDESPFGQTISDEQHWFSEHMKALNWKMTETACWEGMLPMRVLNDGTHIQVVYERVKSRNAKENTDRGKVLYDDGVISGQERSRMEGVDHDEQQSQRQREGVRLMRDISRQQHSAAEEATQLVKVHRNGKTFYRRQRKAAPKQEREKSSRRERVKAAVKRLKDKVTELAIQLSPAAHKVAAILGEVFDTPDDMKKFAYHPGASSGLGGRAGSDFVHASFQDAFGVGVSGHLVASIASRVLVKAFAFAKRKLRGKQVTEDAGGDGVHELARFVRRVYRKIGEELGEELELPSVYDIAENIRRLLKHAHQDA